MIRYITISGKKQLSKIKTNTTQKQLLLSPETFRSMNKSTAIYLQRIEQEQAYSQQLANSFLLQ